MIMLLTHMAVVWANPLIETNDAWLYNLEALLSAMRQVLVDPIQCAMKKVTLMALCQGMCCVAIY